MAIARADAVTMLPPGGPAQRVSAPLARVIGRALGLMTCVLLSAQTWGIGRPMRTAVRQDAFAVLVVTCAAQRVDALCCAQPVGASPRVPARPLLQAHPALSIAVLLSVFLVANGPTLAADASTVAPTLGPDKTVASQALVLSRGHNGWRRPAQNVLAVRDGLQMIWITARTHATQMIQQQPGGNRALELVQDSMHFAGASTNLGEAVAAVIDGANPDPALGPAGACAPVTTHDAGEELC